MKEKILNQISTAVSDKQVTDIVPGQIIVATLVALSAEGRPLISQTNDSSTPLEALTTVPINKQMIGRQVAILFNNGDPDSPVIMGLIQNPLLDILEQQADMDINAESNSESELDMGRNKSQNEFYVDGKKVVIEAEDEIVLKCGDASITLTKSGKILIRGKYVLNRSSGVHRIMGGSVQIN